MRKLILVLCILTVGFSFGQEGSEKRITLKFDNANRIDVIKQIENNSDFKFYFVEEWLGIDKVSGDYKNTPIQIVLNGIFEDTFINYFISTDDKVILSRSILIYDTLPDDFFGASNDNTTPVVESQSLLVDEEKITQYSNTETIRIGKERKNTRLQTAILSGIVRNSSNDPIPNLVITALPSNNNVVTNEKGFYSLEVPVGTNFIETQSIGIERSRKKIIIYENGTYNFKLKESAEMLDEIIIGSQRNRNVREAVTGVTQIKIEAIKNIPLVLGERDILKVATSMPGITKAGEGSSGFNVRGGKADQNLMLLDNGVIYNPSHFFGIFSAINPFTSDNIKIYKGNIPAEYGGRLSSVFEISTKKGNTEKITGEASIGPVTSNLSLELPVVKDKSSLIVGARGTYSDWILKSLDEPSLKNSSASFYDVIAKYDHVFDENNKLEVTGYYSKDSYSITSDSLYAYSNRLASLKWNHRFNSKHSSDLIFANSAYGFDIEYEAVSNGNFNLNYKINESELKLKLNYDYNKKHKFNYGLSGKLYSVLPGNKNPLGSESIVEPVNIPKEKALEAAIFVSDNYTISDKFLVNLGFRFSFYSAMGEATQNVYAPGLPRNEQNRISQENYGNNEFIKTYANPEIRASARYILGQDFSVKGSFNSTYQYLHTLSNNTTASPLDTWKTSDLNIEPQQADQYTLGFYKNYDDDIYELSLEGYYKKSKNILDYKVGGSLLLNTSFETEVLQGDGKAYGIEFLIKKNSGKLNGWFGYSYSKSLIKFNSEFSENRINNGDYYSSNYDKPHNLNIVGNYKLTKRFSFSANFTYQSGRPITYPIGSYLLNGSRYVLFSERNKFRIPDYYRLDVGFNVEGNHRIKKFAHSFWNISVYNVLGKNNPYSVFFVTEGDQIKAYQSSIFSIPIPTITYNFRF